MLHRGALRAARLPAPARVALVLALVLAPAPAHAQDSTAVPDRAPLTVDPHRLRTGTYVYDVVVTSDSGARTIGTHTISVQDAQFAGIAAWHVIDHRESRAPAVVMTAIDTVTLSRSTLGPLRWDAEAGGARFVAAFANDSIYGGATSPMARRTFTIASAPLTITSEGALDAMLQAAPLHPGWVADATMFVGDLGGGRVLPLRLAVEREERIEVPRGEFDVWVVSARTEGAERWLWIDKRSGVVVRAAASPAHMPGMIVERVLVDSR